MDSTRKTISIWVFWWSSNRGSSIWRCQALYGCFLAYVAFLVRLCQTCHPDWSPSLSLESLLRSAQITAHPHWIENLLTSGMGESDVQCCRLGVIIDPRTCQWLNLTPYMMKADIPVWFYWGSEPFYDFPDCWLSSYRPSPFFLRTLQSKMSTS